MTLPAADLPLLMVDWINELFYGCEVDKWVFPVADVNEVIFARVILDV